jgi:hypothetical protein
MRIRSVFTHSTQAVLEGALIAAMVVGLMAGTAFAAKGGGGSHHHGGGTTGGSGTIALVMYANNYGTSGPNWGDIVTFDIATTATTEPWVHLSCSVNGTVVATGWDGYFVGSLTSRTFGLYSPQWTSGAADCVAYLTTPQWSVLGSTSFHVDP